MANEYNVAVVLAANQQLLMSIPDLTRNEAKSRFNVISDKNGRYVSVAKEAYEQFKKIMPEYPDDNIGKKTFRIAMRGCFRRVIHLRSTSDEKNNRISTILDNIALFLLDVCKSDHVENLWSFESMAQMLYGDAETAVRIALNGVVGMESIVDEIYSAAMVWN